MESKKWINIKCYVFTFEITKRIELTYYHGSKIVSLLSTIFNKHPLTDKIPFPIIPYPLEKGRIFKKGDPYHLELTLLGNNNNPISDIINWFLIGNKNINSGDFSSYLKLIHIEEITPRFEPNEKKTNFIHLKLLSPLRHTNKIKPPGKRFFSPDIFEPEYFLELYYNRLVLLSKHYGNTLPAIRAIPRCKLISIDCIWVDDRFRTTLGGIMGEVKFKINRNKFWDEALWLGQYIHVGLNTNFGFGKYQIIK